MTRVRAALQQMLDAHDPYPGVVLDRHWNVVAANAAATALVAGLPDDLLGPPMNIFRVSLRPDGLAGRTRNFVEWATYLVTQLRRLVVKSADPGLDQLLTEVTRYPNVAELMAQPGWGEGDDTALLIPCVLDMGGVDVSLFTTLTTFGTPRDITLDELAVELFFPADEATAAVLARGR